MNIGAAIADFASALQQGAAHRLDARDWWEKFKAAHPEEAAELGRRYDEAFNNLPRKEPPHG